MVWLVVYFLSFVSAISSSKLKWAFTFGLILSSVTDIYSINILNVNITAFGFFIIAISLINFDFLVKEIHSFYSEIKNNSYIKSLLIINTINILFLLIFQEEFDYIKLYLKIYIVIIEAFILYLVAIRNIRSRQIIMEQFVICSLVVNLAIILFQKFGPHFYYEAISYTYGINEIRESGVGRPYGFSREPAHMVVIELLTLTIAHHLKKIYFLFAIAVWVLISILSETRSIVMVMIPLYFYFLFASEEKFLRKIRIVLAMIVILWFYYSINERFSSSINLLSDESTFIRYGLLISSIWQYINDIFLIYPYGSLVKNYCNNHTLILDILNSICDYQTMILNWTIEFLLHNPLIINPLIAIYFYYKNNLFNKKLTVSLYISGLIYFIWASPTSILFIFISFIACSKKLLPLEKGLHENKKTNRFT